MEKMQCTTKKVGEQLENVLSSINENKMGK
jgi:hypothetical protein